METTEIPVVLDANEKLIRRRAAAELRVEKALALIERAQNDLAGACAQLSAVIGAVPEWKRASKLSDACHEAWRKLAYKDRSKWILDREV